MLVLSLLLSMVGTDLLVYSPGFDSLARYQQQIAISFYGQNPVLVCDTALPTGLDSAEIYFIGTPESPFYRRCQKILPVRFHGDTVAIGDSALVAPDYVYHCQFRTPQEHGVELTLAQSGEYAVGETDFFGHDFVLSRARDGALSDTDLAAYGKLEWYGGRYNAIAVNWNPIPARVLDTIADAYIRFCFDPYLLNRDEAQIVFRLAELEYEALSLSYGLRMPRPVTVYLNADEFPGGTRFAHSSRMSTIWLRSGGLKALLDTMDSPVFGLAYELAGIAFQPLSDEYPFTRQASDWAQYASLVGIIPHAAGILGRSTWLEPADYVRIGVRRFEELCGDSRNTFAWLLYEIERKNSSRTLADALRRVLVGKPVPVADLREFMTVLASLTGDDGIIRRTASAFSTPFDPAFFRARNWDSLGTVPGLGDMFLKRTFAIQAVEAGSWADMAGFRPGDRILKIDGCNPVTDRALCLRNLLRKSEGQSIIVLVQRAKKQETIVLPAR